MRLLWLLVLALPSAACAQGWEAVYVRKPAPVASVRVYDQFGRFVGYQTERVESVTVHPVATPMPVAPPVVVAPVYVRPVPTTYYYAVPCEVGSYRYGSGGR